MLRTILQSKLFQYCSISSSASNDPCFPKISDSVPVVLLFQFVSFLPNLNDLFYLLYLKRLSCQLRGRNDEYEPLQECETALVCDRVVLGAIALNVAMRVVKWSEGRFCSKRVSVRDGAGPVVSHGQNIIQWISHGVGHLVNHGIGRGCVQILK